jgi:Uma2 family endonuclease
MNTEEAGKVSSSKPLLTVAYLDTLPDDNNRYELIEGELFVSCAPGLPHQLVLQRLQGELFKFLEIKRIGIVAPGAGAVFSDYDAVIPDLVFVRNERWDQIVANERFVAAPDLVIEVVSPGKENRNRDLLAKRRLYAKYGVEEYWIVDRESLSVMIFRLHDGKLEETATLSEADEITSPLLPGFALNVSTLFILP